WVPGYFQIPIKKGESIIFSAVLTEVSPRSLSKMYEKEIASRTARSSFFNCLKNAAKQFYLKDKDGNFIVSGYPWGVVLARNTMMALPGLTLAIDHTKDFEDIFATISTALEHYMSTGETSRRIAGIDLPDIPLWAIWAIQQYAKAQGNAAARERYTQFISAAIDHIINNGHPNLRVDEASGLLSTMGETSPVSWMNSSLNGRPVIPRSGYLVEFNALWYNALMFAIALTEGNESLADRREIWTETADKLKVSFPEMFLNDYGYLYDYVNGQYADPSVRPNMAVAIGLDYSPLDRRQRKRVLDVVTRELLTPKGLRTLSPKSYGYRPFYLGSPQEREMAQHQGTARPSLLAH
ncbi:MAG: 4-alpha-glucanotransferase, partial [Muribaculaceae bacterium]|nr:4-alpha-glucanotransferase [Muribaculaceae bacterium]